MPHSATENSTAQPSSDEPDAHGQAALILAEATLHALVEKCVLSAADVLAVLQSAHEIKTEVATLAGESEGRMQESLELLKRISISFAADAN
ncbi:MAG: hypothetical protein ACRYFY_06145 [Janthinobacterium lividum]